MRQSLFPLNTVVFPGSILPLKIFEQRYLSLIKDCMKQETGFVTVLISEGNEVGDRPKIFSTGCYVEIIDWESLPDGLLGIKILGKHKVRLSDCTVRHDGLLLATTSRYADSEKHIIPLPASHRPLHDTLKQLLQHPFAKQYRDRVNYDDASDICFRLAELLPISNKNKQLLLETETTEQLLDQIALIINSLQT